MLQTGGNTVLMLFLLGIKPMAHGLYSHDFINEMNIYFDVYVQLIKLVLS